MRKAVLILFTFACVVFSAFASSTQDDVYSIYGKPSDLSFGGHIKLNASDDYGSSSSGTLESVSGHFFAQFTRGSDARYKGVRFGLFGEAEDCDKDGCADRFVSGTSVQGIIGTRKNLVADGDFNINGFAEIGAGVLISPTGVQNMDASGRSTSSINTEYLLLLSPSVGVSFSLDWFCAKMYCTSSYLSPTGFSKPSIGLTAGLLW